MHRRPLFMRLSNSSLSPPSSAMLCCGKDSSSEELQTDALSPPSGGYQLQPLSPISPRPFQVPELPPPPGTHVIHTSPQATGTGTSPPPFPPFQASTQLKEVQVWGVQTPLARPESAHWPGEARFHSVEDVTHSLASSIARLASFKQGYRRD